MDFKGALVLTILTFISLEALFLLFWMSAFLGFFQNILIPFSLRVIFFNSRQGNVISINHPKHKLVSLQCLNALALFNSLEM
jgi:hypothetical protein